LRVCFAGACGNRREEHCYEEDARRREPGPGPFATRAHEGGTLPAATEPRLRARDAWAVLFAHI
jgi:hypothetical protein